MTLAIDRWVAFAGPASAPASPTELRHRHGVAVVWRLELAKLASQIRVRVVAVLCLVVPFVVVAAFKVQTAVPADTLFGQWVHASGYAIPLVILGFAGQWILPLLTAVVAGDIFSSEDHFGTWKTIVTRSRSRGQLFAGKFLASVTYAVAMVVLLAAAALTAALLSGTQPLVGLSGQLVPAGRATELVAASWASQLPPVLGFTALAVALSVISRNSAVGMGGPVLIGLILQLLTLVSLPESVQVALLTTPFAAWHGFWVQAPFFGPLREGLVTTAVWFFVCGVTSWIVFRRRTIAA